MSWVRRWMAEAKEQEHWLSVVNHVLRASASQGHPMQAGSKGGLVVH